MILNGLYFVTHKGDLVASHTTVSPAAMRTFVEIFRTEIILSADKCGAFHKLDDKPTWLVYIAETELFIVASVGDNTGGSHILRLLHDIAALCRSKVGDLTAKSIRENSCWLQTVLDCLFTDGSFAPMDAELLHALSKKPMSALAGSIVKQPAPGSRMPKLHKPHVHCNEVFVEVVSKINLLLAADGKVLADRSMADIVIKPAFPALQPHQLVLTQSNLRSVFHQDHHSYSAYTTDRAPIKDVIFHPCADLVEWHTNGKIVFTPPMANQTMTLMTFRCEGAHENAPFIIEEFEREVKGDTRSEIEFKLKANFPAAYQAESIVVTIPCPHTTTTVNVYLSTGKAKYKPEKGAIRWKIPKMCGGAEETFSAEILCIAPTFDAQKVSRHQPPIEVAFTIPSYNSSGYRVSTVRSLKVGSREVKKYVKYTTKDRAYECRVE